MELTIDAEGVTMLTNSIQSLQQQITDIQAALDKEQKRQEQLEREDARKSAPNYIARVTTQQQQYAEKVGAGAKIGRIVQAFAVGIAERKSYEEVLKTWAANPDNIKRALDIDIVERAQTTTPGSAGGFLIPQVFVAELIELLQNATVVRSMNGARIVPLQNGQARMPKHLTGLTAQYVGELQPIIGSQNSFGFIELTARKLAALVLASKEMLSYSAFNTEALLRDQIVRSIALREDAAFLRSNGGGGTPTGLRFLVNPLHVFNANPIFNLANVNADLYKAITLLESANHTLTPNTTYWLMSPRTKNALAALYNGVGIQMFSEILSSQPRLLGYPVRVSNQIPSNLGATTDASEIYLVNANHVLIGEAMTLELSASDSATVTDGTGTYNTFTQYAMAVRGVTAHDINVEHNTCLAVIDNVRWGV